MQQEEAASVKTLTDAGYTMTTAKTEEAAKVAETMTPYWDEWAKSRGPDVVEALSKCACRSAGERVVRAGMPATALRSACWRRRSARAHSSGLCKYASEAALIIKPPSNT